MEYTKLGHEEKEKKKKGERGEGMKELINTVALN